MNKREITDLIFVASVVAMVTVAGLFVYLVSRGAL